MNVLCLAMDRCDDGMHDITESIEKTKIEKRHCQESESRAENQKGKPKENGMENFTFH